MDKKFTCKCGFTGAYVDFETDILEDVGGYENEYIICPRCGRSTPSEFAFPPEINGDDFYDPEGAAERRQEAMMGYIHSGAGMNAFYEDDAACGGRW